MSQPHLYLSLGLVGSFLLVFGSLGRSLIC